MSRNQYRAVIVGIFFALSLLWIAFVPLGEATDIARGKKIYRMMCLKCHGKEGKGNGPKAKTLSKKPRDYTNKEEMSQLTHDALKKAVIEGKKPMPAFRARLNDKDVENVIAYIKTLAAGGK
ncbi:MAG: c-type cytochrome [Candidatus Methylomirabilales bacterium]